MMNAEVAYRSRPTAIKPETARRLMEATPESATVGRSSTAEITRPGLDGPS